jgi:hypothetical protein
LIHRPESSWTGGLYASPVDVAAFVPNLDLFADRQLLRVGKINVMNEEDTGLARDGTQLPSIAMSLMLLYLLRDRAMTS